MNRIIQVYFVIIITCFQAYAQTDCDCWESEFNGQKIDYSTSVGEMEKEFIDKGYLKDEKPSSYIQLMNSIISKNDYYPFGVEFNPVLVSKFENCFLVNFCDLETFEKIRRMNNLLGNYRHISPEETFSDFRKMFNKADFKKTEVKHYFLTFYYAWVMQTYSGLPRLVETKDAIETYIPLVKRNILKVYAATNDSVYVNETYVKFENLRQVVIKHISDSTDSQSSPEIELVEIEGLGKRKVSKKFIFLLSQLATSYSLYKKVQVELTAAYKEVRNEIGLKEFGVSYEQMLENRDSYANEIKIVRKLLPQRISEAEPINE